MEIRTMRMDKVRARRFINRQVRGFSREAEKELVNEIRS
jgi:hypothetical protein